MRTETFYPEDIVQHGKAWDGWAETKLSAINVRKERGPRRWRFAALRRTVATRSDVTEINVSEHRRSLPSGILPWLAGDPALLTYIPFYRQSQPIAYCSRRNLTFVSPSSLPLFPSFPLFFLSAPPFSLPRFAADKSIKILPPWVEDVTVRNVSGNLTIVIYYFLPRTCFF